MRRNVVRIALLTVVAVALFAVYAIPKIMQGTDDAYAQWGAADMVINYMRDHNGEWPPDWVALEAYFAESNGRVAGWTYDQFKARVYVDFGVDAERLRAASKNSEAVPFDVIRATSIWGAQFGNGPNEMLYRHFRNAGDYGVADSRDLRDD